MQHRVPAGERELHGHRHAACGRRIPLRAERSAAAVDPTCARHQSEQRPIARRFGHEELALAQPRDQARVAPRRRRPYELRRRRVAGEARNVAPMGEGDERDLRRHDAACREHHARLRRASEQRRRDRGRAIEEREERRGNRDRCAWPRHPLRPLLLHEWIEPLLVKRPEGARTRREHRGDIANGRLGWSIGVERELREHRRHRRAQRAAAFIENGFERCAASARCGCCAPASTRGRDRRPWPRGGTRPGERLERVLASVDRCEEQRRQRRTDLHGGGVDGELLRELARRDLRLGRRSQCLLRRLRDGLRTRGVHDRRHVRHLLECRLQADESVHVLLVRVGDEPVRRPGRSNGVNRLERDRHAGVNRRVAGDERECREQRRLRTAEDAELLRGVTGRAGTHHRRRANERTPPLHVLGAIAFAQLVEHRVAVLRLRGGRVAYHPLLAVEVRVGVAEHVLHLGPAGRRECPRHFARRGDHAGSQRDDVGVPHGRRPLVGLREHALVDLFCPGEPAQEIAGASHNAAISRLRPRVLTRELRGVELELPPRQRRHIGVERLAAPPAREEDGGEKLGRAPRRLVRHDEVRLEHAVVAPVVVGRARQRRKRPQ